MNTNLPKYMNIQDFCAYCGFSKFQFMRMADKAGIPIKVLTSDRRSRFVDVQEALRAIENLPDAQETGEELTASQQDASEQPAESAASGAE